MEFQFHNGTIKAAGIRSNSIPNFPFQFHNGTIKALYDAFRVLGECDFNSTMVRLRPGAFYLQDSIESDFNSTMVRLRRFSLSAPGWRSGFQFHNGTIKAK
jgi:hypothetical protein